MTAKRWLQVREFLSTTLFFEPIWNGSGIMVPKNRLINWLWRYADDKYREIEKPKWDAWWKAQK